MELKDVLGLIQSVGFPVVIALWFMFRTEKIIQANTDALARLGQIESAELEALRALLLSHGLPPPKLAN